MEETVKKAKESKQVTPSKRLEMFKTIVHNIIHKNTINQKHKSVRRYPHSCSTGISCTGTTYAPRGEDHNGVDSYTMAIKIHPLVISLQRKTQMTVTYFEIAIKNT